MAKYDSVKEQVASIYRIHLENEFAGQLVFDAIRVVPGWTSGTKNTCTSMSSSKAMGTCSSRTGSTAYTAEFGQSCLRWG
jgi:hypothetical protein